MFKILLVPLQAMRNDEDLGTNKKFECRAVLDASSKNDDFAVSSSTSDVDNSDVGQLTSQYCKADNI
jgi:hypothetical protein